MKAGESFELQIFEVVQRHLETELLGLLPEGCRVFHQWECKDSSRLVDVGDVEEFHAKLQQIGADRTKGTIISRCGFQRAAIAFARAKGIGLGRYSKELQWVMRATGIPQEFIALLRKPEVIESILCGDESFTHQTGIKCFGFSTRQLPLWAAFSSDYIRLQVSQELIDQGFLALDGQRLIRGPNSPPPGD